MGKVVDDYIDFVKRMTYLAIESIDKINESADKINEKKDKNDLKEYYNNKIKDFDKILEKTSKTTKRTGEERPYWHLLKHRFELNEKIKIQRADDDNTISDKLFDFSYDTIDHLIKKGIDDALDKVFEVGGSDELQKLIDDIKKQNTNEDHYLVEAANNIIHKPTIGISNWKSL